MADLPDKTITSAHTRFSVSVTGNMYSRITRYPDWIERIYPPYLNGDGNYIVSCSENQDAERIGDIEIDCGTFRSGPLFKHKVYKVKQSGTPQS